MNVHTALSGTRNDHLAHSILCVSVRTITNTAYDGPSMSAIGIGVKFMHNLAESCTLSSEQFYIHRLEDDCYPEVQQASKPPHLLVSLAPCLSFALLCALDHSNHAVSTSTCSREENICFGSMLTTLSAMLTTRGHSVGWGEQSRLSSCSLI